MRNVTYSHCRAGLTHEALWTPRTGSGDHVPEMSRWIAIAYLCVVTACGFEHGEVMPTDAQVTLPTVEFEMATSTVDEASGTVQIGVDLSEVSTEIVAVSYDVTGGNASRPDDFTLADGTVTFLPGQTHRTIEATINADTVEESDETVSITLSSPTGATLGANTHHTMTISADILPRVSFGNPSSSSAAEASDQSVDVVLTIAPKVPVTVELSVAGTATPGGVDDALTDGQVVSFAANETTKTVPIGVVQDLLDEDDETVVLGLKNPSAKLILATSNTTRTHTITDDDPLPSVSFALAASSTAETANAQLTVSLSAVSGRAVSVNYSVTGGTANVADATVVGAPGTLTFAPGQTTKTIDVTVVDDTLDEADETVVVTLASPTNATVGGIASHTLTITDNDNPPTVGFMSATANATEGNNGTTTVNLIVALSTASGQNVSVSYVVDASSTANNPADYTIAATPLVIPAGSTTGNIVVTVKGDVLDEANETVVVNLGAATNATLTGVTTETLTINDDDTAPTAKFSAATASQNEGTVTVTVDVVLSAVSGRTVTVPYTVNAATTASNPSDYSSISPASQVTIAAGQTSATITISLADDFLDEPNETLILDLDTPVNASLATPSSYTLTIVDNDATPTVSWNPAEADQTENEGTAPPPTRNKTFTIVLSAASSTNVVVPLNYSGTATEVTDYTGPSSVTINAGQTSANVTLTIVKDALKENGSDETIIMDIVSAGVTGANPTTPLRRTYSLKDDD